MNLRSIESLRDGMIRSRVSLLAVGAIVPVLAAVLLCVVGSLWPLRLDYRSLQDVHKLEGLGLPRSSGRFLFLSADNSMESARTATFALKQLAFPSGAVDWMALTERCNGPWASGFFAVDSDGQGYRQQSSPSGVLSWSPVESPREAALADTTAAYVIFDSDATRQAFESRWPFLKQAVHVNVLSDSTVKSIARRRFASEFSAGRILRIASVMGTFFAAFLILIQLPLLRRSPTVFSAAVALFAALGFNVSFAYLAQWVSPALVRWSPAFLWMAGLAVAVSLKTGAWRWKLAETGWEFGALSGSGRAALALSSLIYSLLFLARLDFDGDFFNNWLPQGRYFYLLGHHDPSLIAQQGLMQAASYPPGYGIMLSTIMWMTGMDPSASFLPGTQLSFAILIYRLLILALNLSLLLLITGYLKRLGAEKSALWMPALIVLMLLIPTTAAKHVAAETVLFPMLAASIVLIAAGRRCGVDGFTVLGLLIGGMATLVKWEAGLIFAVGVLPWLFPLGSGNTRRLSKSTVVVWLMVTALACLPALIWKITVPIHNQFFGSVSISRLLTSAPQFVALVGSAARMMLEDGRLIFFTFALSCALIFRLRAKPRWAALIVPASIAALLIGWIFVFLFSNLPAQTYLETSYSRLIMIPTFSAILYCADAMVDWSRASAKVEAAPVPAQLYVG